MSSSTLDSLESEVRELKAIAGALLAFVILLFVLLGIQEWLFCRFRHSGIQKQPREANTARDLVANPFPDPSVFELGNVHRDTGSSNSSRSSNDDGWKAIEHGGFLPPKPLELARGQSQTPYRARHQRTASSHGTLPVSSSHSDTRSSRADGNLPIPQARPIRSNTEQSFGTDYTKTRRA